MKPRPPVDAPSDPPSEKHDPADDEAAGAGAAAGAAAAGLQPDPSPRPRGPSGDTSADASAPEDPLALVPLALKSVVGGSLMGLANLVPGISGGTMLLAAGIYPRFIKAIAEVTTFRFRVPSVAMLLVVIISALVAIGGLAGVVKDLVVHHRWIMYSIFIGLTLGGVPVVWRMARPPSRGLWIGAAAGLVAMSLLALAQTHGVGSAGADRGSFPMLILGGVAGASAMILPGVSGGYLLLVLGQYLAILGGIHALMVALRSGDLAAALDPAVGVVLPVAIGVMIGVVVVSNLLQMLLNRFEKPTLGVLLGLLVGAVVGLWPFQAGVRPAVGEVVQGQTMTAELLEKLSPDKYPTELFSPSAGQILAALGLIALGFAATTAVARLGRSRS